MKYDYPTLQQKCNVILQNRKPLFTKPKPPQHTVKPRSSEN